MKGVVFTEFLTFVAEQRDEDFVDDLMAACNLSQTSYTAVGTYDFSELATLVGGYCQMTGTSMPDALKGFGHHLAKMFQAKFPDFYASQPGIMEFVACVDGQIHVEVRKLYPDAELPRFTIVKRGADCMSVDYASCRPLGDLAVGLIEGSSAYYRQPIKIDRTAIEDEMGARTRFDIQLV